MTFRHGPDSFYFVVFMERSNNWEKKGSKQLYCIQTHMQKHQRGRKRRKGGKELESWVRS